MKIIAPLMMTLTAVSAFCPHHRAATTTTTTAVSMGLFDFLNPPKKDDSSKKKKGEMDAGVFGGKADRITVREDEDNAMWVDEDDKGNRKGAGPFGRGGGK